MAKKNTSVKNPKKQNARKAQKPSPLTWIILAGIGIIVIYGFYFQFSKSSHQNIAVPEITVEEAYQKYQEGVLVLDVRTPEEYNQGHIQNAKNIPLDELNARISELSTDQEMVVICKSGNRSHEAVVILLKAGFQKVSTVVGGMNNWKAAGYPVINGG